MNKKENKVCSNCALCSFVYPINRTECDKDNHIIIDEIVETCENFVIYEDDDVNS